MNQLQNHFKSKITLNSEYYSVSCYNFIFHETLPKPLFKIFKNEKQKVYKVKDLSPPF